MSDTPTHTNGQLHGFEEAAARHDALRALENVWNDIVALPAIALSATKADLKEAADTVSGRRVVQRYPKSAVVTALLAGLATGALVRSPGARAKGSSSVASAAEGVSRMVTEAFGVPQDPMQLRTTATSAAVRLLLTFAAKAASDYIRRSETGTPPAIAPSVNGTEHPLRHQARTAPAELHREQPW